MSANLAKPYVFDNDEIISILNDKNEISFYNIYKTNILKIQDNQYQRIQIQISSWILNQINAIMISNLRILKDSDQLNHDNCFHYLSQNLINSINHCLNKSGFAKSFKTLKIMLIYLIFNFFLLVHDFKSENPIQIN